MKRQIEDNWDGSSSVVNRGIICFGGIFLVADVVVSICSNYSYASIDFAYLQKLLICIAVVIIALGLIRDQFWPDVPEQSSNRKH